MSTPTTTQFIGRYEIKAELGRGGMATVYLAYDPRFERDVAIKVLPHAFLHDPQFRSRFEREAKTIALLEHPAIVPVYDFGEQDEQPFIVMRYMAGGSLADRIKQGALTLVDAAKLIERLAPALDAAHARGVIHRDMKPGNVLFDQYGNAYLSDFGIARLSQESGATLTGSAIVGTPAYMSPEQIQGEKTIDGRSDIYALGVMAYQMITGQTPYHADTPAKLMMMHVLEPVPHLDLARGSLPGEVDVVLGKALAKQPEDRYNTTGEFAAAFGTAARIQPASPAATSYQGETLVYSGQTRITSRPISGTARPVSTALPSTSTAPAHTPSTSLPVQGAAARPSTPAMQPALAPRRSRTGLLLAGGVVVILLGLFAGGLALTGLRGSGPLAMLALAGLKPTQSPTSLPDTQPVAALLEPSSTPTPIPSPTPTIKLSTAVPPIAALPSPEYTSTPTETPLPSVPLIGGADRIAYLNESDIWIAYLDGSGLARLTEDGSPKTGLQWLPDGKAVLFISGNCANMIDIESGRQDIVTCFQYIESLKAFEVSPDGSQVAVTLDNQLYIVPFDIETLKTVSTRGDLTAMTECKEYAPYLRNLVERVRWSKDGTTVAVQLIANLGNGQRGEVIQAFRVDRCIPNPAALDNFPMQRFTIKGYTKNPVIPAYAWDGNFLFAMTNVVRNEGFGDLYIYNMDLHKARPEVNPVEKHCCYRDPSWSPDGTYLVFAFQDMSAAGAPARLYLISYSAIGEQTSFDPLPLPEITDPRESVQPVLRPAR